jgi:hypothetical protein
MVQEQAVGGNFMLPRRGGRWVPLNTREAGFLIRKTGHFVGEKELCGKQSMILMDRLGLHIFNT